MSGEDTDRYTGACDGCDHQFIEAPSTDVVDHVFREHSEQLDEWDDVASMVAFDFALSDGRVKTLHQQSNTHYYSDR